MQEAHAAGVSTRDTHDSLRTPGSASAVVVAVATTSASIDVQEYPHCPEQELDPIDPEDRCDDQRHQRVDEWYAERIQSGP